MTEPLADPSPEEDRIRAALPGLRNRRIMGGIAVAAAGAAGFFGVIWSLSLDVDGEDKWKLALICAGVAGFACFWIARATTRAHEAALLPIIAGAMGLSHGKDGKRFLRGAPAPFLPMGGQQSGDDVLSGRIGDRRFTIAEVETETGGKNSRTLFKGLLLEVPAPGTPGLLAAPADHTKPGMVFRADVDVQALRWLGKDAGGGPGGTELYSTGNTPMPGKLAGEVLARLMTLGDPVGGRFFAAVCTGSHLWVAISHERNLFSIGGVTADHHTVMADIRRATGDFAAPVALAGKAMEFADWLRAEAAAVPA